MINPNVGTITAFLQRPDGSLQPLPGAELGTSLAGLQGRPSPSDGPEAELWLGAHPGDPSTVRGPGGQDHGTLCIQ